MNSMLELQINQIFALLTTIKSNYLVNYVRQNEFRCQMMDITQAKHKCIHIMKLKIQMNMIVGLSFTLFSSFTIIDYEDYDQQMPYDDYMHPEEYGQPNRKLSFS